MPVYDIRFSNTSKIKENAALNKARFIAVK
jgi:hypothetical protein